MERNKDESFEDFMMRLSKKIENMTLEERELADLIARAEMPEKERVKMLFAAQTTHFICDTCRAPRSIEMAAKLLPFIMALMDFEKIYSTDSEGLKEALNFNNI